MNLRASLLAATLISVSAALANLHPRLAEVSLVVFGATFGALLIIEIIRENGRVE